MTHDEIRAYETIAKCQSWIEEAKPLLERGAKAESALAALQREVALLTEWRPMETAPRDGTLILTLNDDDQYRLCFWYSGQVERYWRMHHSFDSCVPARWLPLPAATEALKKGAVLP